MLQPINHGYCVFEDIEDADYYHEDFFQTKEEALALYNSIDIKDAWINKYNSTGGASKGYHRLYLYESLLYDGDDGWTYGDFIDAKSYTYADYLSDTTKGE